MRNVRNVRCPPAFKISVECHCKFRLVRMTAYLWAQLCFDCFELLFD